MCYVDISPHPVPFTGGGYLVQKGPILDTQWLDYKGRWTGEKNQARLFSNMETAQQSVEELAYEE